MAASFNILVSSAGRRVALLRILRRTLADLGLEGRVLAADMSRLSAAFHQADHGVLVPPCTAAEFVPTMLEICRENEVRLLVPTIDTELSIYAAHRDRFASAGTTVAVSSLEVVEIGGDKVRTHDWLTEHGFPTVRQASAEEVLAGPEGWTYPLLVKPRYGSSSIGVSTVRDRAQLEAAARGRGYIVQTIAPGVEYTVDCLVNGRGRCPCAVPRRRFEVRAGEVSKGMTVRSELLQGLASRLCEALPGAYGVLNVQVFREEASGEVRVIELNPRFGGGYPLAWEAGAEFPRWLIEEILGLASTASADGWRDGLVMLRYDDAVFVGAEKAGV